MILATWNVNGIRARAQRLTEWLAERKPDVACLQELKGIEDDVVKSELQDLGRRIRDARAHLATFLKQDDNSSHK